MPDRVSIYARITLQIQVSVRARARARVPRDEMSLNGGG